MIRARGVVDLDELIINAVRSLQPKLTDDYLARERSVGFYRRSLSFRIGNKLSIRGDGWDTKVTSRIHVHGAIDGVCLRRGNAHHDRQPRGGFPIFTGLLLGRSFFSLLWFLSGFRRYGCGETQ